jgi:hypothetical protein
MSTENASKGDDFRGLSAPVFELTLRMILPVMSQATPSGPLQCNFHRYGEPEADVIREKNRLELPTSSSIYLSQAWTKYLWRAAGQRAKTCAFAEWPHVKSLYRKSARNSRQGLTASCGLFLGGLLRNHLRPPKCYCSPTNPPAPLSYIKNGNKKGAISVSSIVYIFFAKSRMHAFHGIWDISS